MCWNANRRKKKQKSPLFKHLHQQVEYSQSADQQETESEKKGKYTSTVSLLPLVQRHAAESLSSHHQCCCFCCHNSPFSPITTSSWKHCPNYLTEPPRPPAAALNRVPLWPSTVPECLSRHEEWDPATPPPQPSSPPSPPLRSLRQNGTLSKQTRGDGGRRAEWRTSPLNISQAA